MSRAEPDRARLIDELQANQPMSDEARDWTTENECRAMRLLHEDGWSKRELGMTFMMSPDQAMYHVHEHCRHEHDDENAVEEGA